jgi:hypothetical protein
VPKASGGHEAVEVCGKWCRRTGPDAVDGIGTATIR